MDKSRLLSAALCLLLLTAWSAATVAPARAEEKGEKKDEKTAKDKIREMFGGELIEHMAMPLFSISVIREEGVTDQVNIAITIETKGEKSREIVVAQRQKLYDAYLRDLYGLLNIKRADGQLFDQQVVKIRLMRVSDKLLGPGVVNSILVRGISPRPFNTGS